VLTILVGTPLVGLAFGLPGEGQLAFFVIGVLWACALAPLRRTSLAPTTARADNRGSHAHPEE
jgi:hypothetical protein